jgi:hypothetical protein
MEGVLGAVGLDVAQQPVRAGQPEPVGRVSDQPAPDAATAVRRLDVQLPDLRPSGQPGHRAAHGQIALHLVEADHPVVQDGVEAGAVPAEAHDRLEPG